MIALLDEEINDDGVDEDDDESIVIGVRVFTGVTTEAAVDWDGVGVDEAAAADNAVEDKLI